MYKPSYYNELKNKLYPLVLYDQCLVEICLNKIHFEMKLIPFLKKEGDAFTLFAHTATFPTEYYYCCCVTQYLITVVASLPLGATF